MLNRMPAILVVPPILLALTILALGAALAASPSQQEPSPASGNGAPADKGALTLTGCVARVDMDRFTLDDMKNGKFELKGASLDRYVGKRVEVRGSSSRVHVAGGLWPSPNVAAQAGGIDPVQAAVAAMPGGGTHGTGSDELPEFRATRIRTVKGDCK